MLIIDNKKYRNLQEQVGWNSEQIEKIFSFLDGLEVEDNLIKLDNASGTLTAEEMEIVSRDVAFIIYSNNLYVKTTTSATEFIFKQVALSASDNGTYNILQSFRIVVTRASGAYAYSSNTVLSLYNKAEMDALLAGKANLSGDTFTGAVVAPTLEQTQANWSADITNVPNITGGTATMIFGRAQKLNQEFHIVVFCKIANNSGGAITGYGTSDIGVTLPSSIASKIFDANGNNVTNNQGQYTRISATLAYASKNANNSTSGTLNNVYMFVMNNSNNQIRIQFASPTLITINDGETLYLEARVSLDLI